MSDALLEAVQKPLAQWYRLLRRLEGGGMASVFLADDLKHHRRVAIKTVTPQLALITGQERFRREIEIVAQMNHPHIVPLFDSGEAGGVPYFVMPFIEGESLRQRLERQKQLPAI